MLIIYLILGMLAVSLICFIENHIKVKRFQSNVELFLREPIELENGKCVYVVPTAELEVGNPLINPHILVYFKLKEQSEDWLFQTDLLKETVYNLMAGEIIPGEQILAFCFYGSSDIELSKKRFREFVRARYQTSQQLKTEAENHFNNLVSEIDSTQKLVTKRNPEKIKNKGVS